MVIPLELPNGAGRGDWIRRSGRLNYKRVAIPTLVRIKTGALGRMGIYLSRQGHRRVAVFQSAGLLDDISSQMRLGLLSASIEPIVSVSVAANEFERAISYFTDLPRAVTAIVGIGGGKALDVAKYVAFLGKPQHAAVKADQRRRRPVTDQAHVLEREIPIASAHRAERRISV